jgi:hypothetical protein
MNFWISASFSSNVRQPRVISKKVAFSRWSSNSERERLEETMRNSAKRWTRIASKKCSMLLSIENFYEEWERKNRIRKRKNSQLWRHGVSITRVTCMHLFFTFSAVCPKENGTSLTFLHPRAGEIQIFKERHVNRDLWPQIMAPGVTWESQQLAPRPFLEVPYNNYKAEFRSRGVDFHPPIVP